jgi:hypothetical protein
MKIPSLMLAIYLAQIAQYRHIRFSILKIGVLNAFKSNAFLVMHQTGNNVLNAILHSFCKFHLDNVNAFLGMQETHLVNVLFVNIFIPNVPNAIIKQVVAANVWQNSVLVLQEDALGVCLCIQTVSYVVLI